MLTFEEKNLLHFGLCDVATVVLWPLDVATVNFLGLQDVATVTIVSGDWSQCY